MRTYIELFEVLPPEATGEADFIRVDVTEWSFADVAMLIESLREYAEENYDYYILQLHECRHDEEPRQSCSVRILYSRLPAGATA